MTRPPAESKDAELLRFWMSVNHDAISGYVGSIVSELREGIVKAIKEELTNSGPLEGFEPSATASKPPVAGVQLGDGDATKLLTCAPLYFWVKFPRTPAF